MKFNQWTLALAAAGVVSLASAAQAEEAKNQVLTALSSTTLSGYIDTSAIWRPGTGNLGGAGATTGGAKQDGFNLNVIKMTLSKPLDEGQWAAGYNVDLLYGPDANIYSGTAGSVNDFAIQQAYVNMRAPVGNGLDFKMGVFNTIIGYENFDSFKNPNYSRSYGWAIEPLQHTGLLASYQVNEIIGMSAGIADTSTSAINARALKTNGTAAESRKTYMASFSLMAPESTGFLAGSMLYAGMIDGFGGTLSGANQINWYVGATLKTPVQGLAVGASYDYAGAAANTGHGPADYANATALYLSYQATEKLKLNGRAEYASMSSKTLNSAQVLALTGTVDYSLWANVITRLELRWDHDLSARADGAMFDTAAGNFAAKNLVTLALNVIYRF
jgi:hypothetical protein